LYILSDGEVLYLIHNGKTRVYNNPHITSVSENHSKEIEPIYSFNEPQKFIRSRPEIDISLDFICSDMEIINEEINLELVDSTNKDNEKIKIDKEEIKRNLIESMTIKELLNVFNKKVDQRKESDR